MAKVSFMAQKVNKQNQFRVLGLMSGTSLDGLDLCLADFRRKDHWEFEILRSKTMPYSKPWLENLVFRSLDTEGLKKLDQNYGQLLAEMVNSFIDQEGLDRESIDFIASHGHTWFHKPHLGQGLQIGNGPELWQGTKLPVVCDFRKADLRMGGQGAPLVPIGDRDLFPQFDACLNLGGFANISFDRAGERLAFDIAPCNLPLNYFARRLGLPYDDGGYIAASTNSDQDLLNKLNKLDYYATPAPKSLGIEWLETEVFPLCQSTELSPEVLIATLSDHSAQQIAKSLNDYQIKKVLISGGGSYNQFILDSIGLYSSATLEIAEEPLNSFKEALIFAYLGLLRKLEQNNILASVTGASADHCSGKLYP